jgi:hypothetical protein
VDIAWLAAFRCLFGLVLCVSMLRFLIYGWVDRFFVEPAFHFKYWGFDWVAPLSGSGMHWVFGLLVVSAVGVACGALFRLSAALLAAGLSYVQLIDVTTYLNHYYLAALLAWLLACSPAHRAYSVDAWFARRSPMSSAAVAIPSVAAAWLYLLRFQVGTVYFFAGLAKAQTDWLVHAQPLRIWLGAKTEMPGLGPLLLWDGAPLVFSWAGFLFDTTIVFWLSSSKTRRYAFILVVVFHALTSVLFPIGMFPAIMVTSALVFFLPSWPRELARRAGVHLARGRRQSPTAASAILAPLARSTKLQQLGWSLAIAYCAIQVMLPSRHLAYGGNVLWHEQGMRFSWRVMVRAKGGSTHFVVDSASGHSWRVAASTYLTPMQESEMASQPDLILQLAHHIAWDFERRGLGPVAVHARAHASLNGRRSATIVNPDVDLTSVKDGISFAHFVLPAPTEAPPRTRLVP